MNQFRYVLPKEILQNSCNVLAKRNSSKLIKNLLLTKLLLLPVSLHNLVVYLQGICVGFLSGNFYIFYGLYELRRKYHAIIVHCSRLLVEFLCYCRRIYGKIQPSVYLVWVYRNYFFPILLLNVQLCQIYNFHGKTVKSESINYSYILLLHQG